MNMNKIYDFNGYHGISDIYTFSGSCGKYDGEECVTKETENGFESIRDKFTFSAEVVNEDSVYMRTDKIENTSKEDIYINSYSARFTFAGGEFDVYTQSNRRLSESNGEWQKLITEISASGKGIYSTSISTPMMALWNRQTNRGVVFHLLPQYAWRISVSSKNRVADRVYTVVDISIYDDSLNIKLPSKEKINFSPVIYYEFKDRQTLDCHKLHKFCHKLFPRKDMPVIYNTWLAFFDNVNYDKVSQEVERAADLGCDYFVLDAGWFGKDKDSWSELIGQWEENLKGGYEGRMKELSDLVRKNNMKFGIWLEPERARMKAEILHKHPEYFIKGQYSWFLDFTNVEAREYITDVTLKLIEKYNIEFLKFDFNDNIISDKDNSGFLFYQQGYIEYIKSIKEKYPDIYFECCGAGGFRTDIEKLRYFDSFWFSDNQNAVSGLDIIKNTLLRMPPQAIDRWLAITSAKGLPDRENLETGITSRTVTTSDPIWGSAVGVSEEYIKGFLTGGQIGITTNIGTLESKVKDELKAFIAEYKREKPFWMNAVARILCDTPQFIAVQYEYENKIKIVVYTRYVAQFSFTFYPVIEKCDYIVDGKHVSYDELITEGITINEPRSDYSYTISLEKSE